MTLKTLSVDKLEKKANKILAVYVADGGKLSDKAINSIVAALIGYVKRNHNKRTFDRKDIKNIFKRFKVGNLNDSYENWLRRNAFEYLTDKLKAAKNIRCASYRIPKRARRFLVFDSDENVIRNIPYVQAIQEDLLNLRPFESGPAAPRRKTISFKNLKKEETEYLCSFIASAAIFGKVLFDDFHLWLTELTLKDVYFNPCYINKMHPEGYAFRRFFLPFPASAYLMRCILFYRKYAGKLKLKITNDPASHVFNAKGKRSIIVKEFRQWTAERLKAKGIYCEKGLDIKEFRRAVKSASLLNLPDKEKENYDFPPFLVAIQSNSEELESYSYSNRHFEYLLDIMPDREDYNDRPGSDMMTFSARKDVMNNCISGIISEITVIRRKLLKPGMHHLEKRRSAVQAIYRVLSDSSLDHRSGDYRNLTLYVWWLEEMIRNEKIKESTMNTAAGLIPKLLGKLIGTRAIDKLPLEELVLILSQTMYEYRSQNIKSALKKFCDFLAGKKIGGHFTEINWRSRELMKRNIPTTKSFVHFDELDLALEKADAFYCTHARKLKPEKLKSDMADSCQGENSFPCPFV